MNDPIYSKSGEQVGYVANGVVFDLSGKKLYDLDGVNMVDLSTKAIVGHLRPAFEVPDDKPDAAERLFPSAKDVPG